MAAKKKTAKKQVELSASRTLALYYTVVNVWRRDGKVEMRVIDRRTNKYVTLRES